MLNIFRIYLLGIKDILKKKILSLLILPMVASFLIWILISFISWNWLNPLCILLYQSAFIQFFVVLLSPLLAIGITPFSIFLKLVIVFSFYLPIVLAFAIFFISIFLIPVLVDDLIKKEFSKIKKNPSSIFKGYFSKHGPLSLTVKYLLCWFFSMPFWLFLPFGNVIIPFILLAWFNSRFLSWEVLLEIVSIEDAKIHILSESTNIWKLGLITSPLYFIPIFNFFAPAITASIYSRFWLSILENKTKS
jgi:hypothetical protein